MANWTEDPSSVREEKLEIPINIFETRTGIEVRTALRSTPRRTWKCYFNLDNEGMLKAHYLAQKGSLEKFVFTNPEDDTEYNVRYLDDSIARKKVAGEDMFEVEVSIIEVLGES